MAEESHDNLSFDSEFIVILLPPYNTGVFDYLSTPNVRA